MCTIEVPKYRKKVQHAGKDSELVDDRIAILTTCVTPLVFVCYCSSPAFVCMLQKGREEEEEEEGKKKKN